MRVMSGVKAVVIEYDLNMFTLSVRFRMTVVDSAPV